jgi:plasmid stabilization system protein ParE
MIFEIEVTNEAETDLRGIYEYSAFKLLHIPDKEKAVVTIIRVMYGGRDDVIVLFAL